MNQSSQRQLEEEERQNYEDNSDAAAQYEDGVVNVEAERFNIVLAYLILGGVRVFGSLACLLIRVGGQINRLL